MNKVTFLPSVSDRIQDIILENNIVTPITIIENEDNSIDMEFEIVLHGRFATARVPILFPLRG